MFNSIGSLMSQSLQRKGIGKKIATAQAITLAQTAVDALLPHMVGKVKISSLKNGVLTVTCAPNSDSQAVVFASDDIKQLANMKLETELISHVVVKKGYTPMI